MSKYQEGDIIQINSDYHYSPGIKQLKKGKYLVTKFGPSIVTPNRYNIYHLKSIRRNSTYIHHFSQIWVEENSEKINN